MTPNIPNACLPILGPTPNGAMGGVPWTVGVLRALVLKGLRAAASFDTAPGRPLLVVTDSDNDLDGPGGYEDDPTGEPHTSLRYPGGTSCDSRTFPGVVMSPALARFGVRVGDFCLVAWQGNYCSAQVYDVGPTRKAGENSLYVNRFLGIVPKNKSDHWAALNGHDAQDVCTLFFPGSGLGHAVSQAEIVARTHALWNAFTGRTVVDLAASPAKGSGAASGSVGLAVPLCLSALVAVASSFSWEARHLASSPIPPDFAGWLACASTAGTLILLFLHIRKEMRPDPPLEEVYATIEELERIEADSRERDERHEKELARIETAFDGRHKENVQKLDGLQSSLNTHNDSAHKEREKLRVDLRHDVKEAVTPILHTITAQAEDSNAQFRQIAGEVGELKASVRSNDALAAEVRTLMNTVLQRLPRGGAQG